MPISKSEWKLATGVGRKRLRAGRESKGWKGRTVDQESIGVIGEIIACKFFNKTPKFVYGKGDDCDLSLWGKTADVKTSLMKESLVAENLHLLAHKVSHSTDLYIRVLITPEINEAILAGWTTREYMVQYAGEMEYNGHLLYKLDNDELFDLRELKTTNPDDIKKESINKIPVSLDLDHWM